MSISDSEPGFVELKGGLTVPVAALTLLLRLYDQGFTFEVMGDVLALRRADKVPAGDVLSADDRAAITRWKQHLISLMNYRDPDNSEHRGRLSVSP